MNECKSLANGHCGTGAREGQVDRGQTGGSKKTRRCGEAWRGVATYIRDSRLLRYMAWRDVTADGLTDNALHVILHITDLRFLSQMELHDVASNICQAPAAGAARDEPSEKHSRAVRGDRDDVAGDPDACFHGAAGGHAVP